MVRFVMDHQIRSYVTEGSTSYIMTFPQCSIYFYQLSFSFFGYMGDSELMEANTRAKPAEL